MQRPHLVLLIIVVGATACRSLRAPLSLPPLSPTVRYTTATASRGPDVTSATFHIELFAVADAPAGTAIAQAAAAIIRDRGQPFRGKSRLPIGTRWLSPVEAEQWQSGRGGLDSSRLQELGTAPAIVAGHLDTSLQVDAPGMPTVLMEPGTDAIEVTLITAADADGAREELRLAAGLPSHSSAALFVPAPELGLGGYLLSLRPAPAPTGEELARAEQLARQDAEPAPAPADRPRPWQVALHAIGEHNRRPALLALFGPLGLTRAVDMVLTGDEAALIAISEQLRDVDPNAEDVAWRVELAIWRALMPRIERDELTPAMKSALRRELGAVTDDPSTLQLLLQTSRDLQSFAEALREENLANLNDRSTALRVAAHTWLGDRKTTVPDYDPLGDRDARRRALRHYFNERDREQRSGSR